MYILIEVPDEAAPELLSLARWLKAREFDAAGEVVTFSSPGGKAAFMFRLLDAVIG
jgi:hypothetical protein